jgi:hypothetical protein
MIIPASRQATRKHAFAYSEALNSLICETGSVFREISEFAVVPSGLKANWLSSGANWFHQ